MARKFDTDTRLLAAGIAFCLRNNVKNNSLVKLENAAGSSSNEFNGSHGEVISFHSCDECKSNALIESVCPANSLDSNTTINIQSIVKSRCANHTNYRMNTNSNFDSAGDSQNKASKELTHNDQAERAVDEGVDTDRNSHVHPSKMTIAGSRYTMGNSLKSKYLKWFSKSVTFDELHEQDDNGIVDLKKDKKKRKQLTRSLTLDDTHTGKRLIQVLHSLDEYNGVFDANISLLQSTRHRRNAVCELNVEERIGLKTYLQFYISEQFLDQMTDI